MRLSVGCSFSGVYRPLHYFPGDIAEWVVREWEVRDRYLVYPFPNRLLQMCICNLEL